MSPSLVQQSFGGGLGEERGRIFSDREALQDPARISAGSCWNCGEEGWEDFHPAQEGGVFLAGQATRLICPPTVQVLAHQVHTGH